MSSLPGLDPITGEQGREYTSRSPSPTLNSEHEQEHLISSSNHLLPDPDPDPEIIVDEHVEAIYNEDVEDDTEKQRLLKTAKIPGNVSNKALGLLGISPNQLVRNGGKSDPITGTSPTSTVHSGVILGSSGAADKDTSLASMLEQPCSPSIHHAAQRGEVETVKELLAKGIFTATDRDFQNVTALHWAAINNRLDVASVLLERGAEVDAKGGDLLATPLHWACR